MNNGSSVLNIVVEPATDCCRNVGVEDTTEQFFMVHIVECSCQIEHDEHCSVSRLCKKKASSPNSAAMPAVLFNSAVHVECFGRSHVEQGGKVCV